MKKLLTLLAAFMLIAGVAFAQKPKKKIQKHAVVAYVTSWSDGPVDPFMMTHVNYAFGHVNAHHDGVRLVNEDRMRLCLDLKKQNPDLKVLISIGGWGSGGFSEMARDARTRKAFAADCQRLCKAYGFDGIDIDWEYPTSDDAGIGCHPDDTKNYTLMMKDIREAIGRDKLLTLASKSDAQYIDFRAILPYIDFVNIMSYDMDVAPRHHAPLYRSEATPCKGRRSCEESVKCHLDAGVPAHMLNLGLPFYGHGCGDFDYYLDYKDIPAPDAKYPERWDKKACVPYRADKQGNLVMGYDNAKSIELKCKWAVEQGLLGVLYWEYAADGEKHPLVKAAHDATLGK